MSGSAGEGGRAHQNSMLLRETLKTSAIHFLRLPMASSTARCEPAILGFTLGAHRVVWETGPWASPPLTGGLWCVE